MGEYTAATLAAVVLVVLVEVAWARTGNFRSVQYWLTVAIVVFFQTLVDGRLTLLPDPVVSYAPEQLTGVRFPLDIPVEDFGFGFALVTATIMLWRLSGRDRHNAVERAPGRLDADRHRRRRP